MKGYTHALSGAAGWLAMTSTSTYALGLVPMNRVDLLAGTLLCAGAAMAPDCDHPSGTIAHSLPPISKWVCRAVAAISGGHREATHSILGVGVFWGLSSLASLFVVTVQGREIALGGGVLAVLMIAFAAKVFGLAREAGRSVGGFGKDILGSFIGPWVLSLGGAAALTWFLDYKWTWLPFAIALGCFIHILGDCLTPQGVPWLWPFKPKPPRWLRKTPVLGQVVGFFWRSSGRFRIPLLGTVNLDRDRNASMGERIARTFNRENILAFLITIYITYMLIFEATSAAGSNVLR